MGEMMSTQCPHCNGQGYKCVVVIEYDACVECDGTGYVLRCGDCGQPLELVRPGRFQCVNPECVVNAERQ
jgi:RecJ-like exonuclease